jgi:hypothetical protein
MDEKRSLDFEIKIIKNGSRADSDRIKRMVNFHGERAGNDVARKSQTSYGFSALRIKPLQASAKVQCIMQTTKISFNGSIDLLNKHALKNADHGPARRSSAIPVRFVLPTELSSIDAGL